MRWAINSSYVPISTPMKQGWAIGGQVMRRWTSRAPASRSSLQQRAGGVAAHDAVVDHDHALVAQVLLEHVELERHALLAQLVGGLDERAPDVAVFDEPVVVGDAGSRGRSRSPPGSRNPAPG